MSNYQGDKLLALPCLHVLQDSSPHFMKKNISQKKTSKKWKCLQAPWSTQITKIPIRHHSLQKKTGFAIITCETETTLNTWRNPTSPRDNLSILWGPDFPMVPKVISGGPRFSKPQPLMAPWSLLLARKGHWKPTRDFAPPRVNVGGAEKNDGKDRRGAGDGDDMWTQVQDHLEVGFEFFETSFIPETWGGFMEIGKTNKDESVELSLSRVQKSALVQIPLKRNNIYNTVITVLTPFGKSTQILPKVEENLGLFWQKVKEEEEKKTQKKTCISDTLPKTNRSRRPQVPVSSKHMRLCL